MAAPAIDGLWKELPYKCPINPIHGALLNTGQVLFVAGSGNNTKNIDTPNGSAVFDYEKGTFERPITPVDENGKPFDLFCGGHSFLSDGSLLFAGGTLQYTPFKGLPAAFVFSPTTKQWKTVQPMQYGRWYPTLVTLSDGRVLAVSGRNENGPICMLPEIYDPAANTWNTFKETSKLPMYAQLFLLSTGQIFYSGMRFSTYQGLTPRLLTLPTNLTQPIAENSVPGIQTPDFGNQGASVLLPVAQDQRVMIVGGGDARKTLPNGSSNPTYQTTTKRVNIVDLSLANPSYKPAANLNYARMHHNAVLLPDRTVFVCNGSTREKILKESLLPAEIYDPVNNTWAAVATPTVSDRVYHSGALLLPNATVLTFGGNPNGNYYQSKLEVYSPPYLFKGPQPVIQQVPPKVTYSQTFTIETPQAEDIKWVSLIKPMATTHSTDTEQRLVGVSIKSKTANSLTVRLTGVKNVAPPGWYMLFITNYLGVPSVANWIQLN